jgi:hypothetical protein
MATFPTGLPVPKTDSVKQVQLTRSNTLAAATAPKTLLGLPKGAVITSVEIFSQLAADPLTSADISVGRVLPGTFSITAAGTTATVTTALPHGYGTSGTFLVHIIGSNTANFNTSAATTATVTSATTFTYTISSTTATDTSGTVYLLDQFLNTIDVKTAAGLITPTTKIRNVMVAMQSDTLVVGFYKEAGTASTVGGPFYIVISYIMTPNGEYTYSPTTTAFGTLVL